MSNLISIIVAIIVLDLVYEMTRDTPFFETMAATIIFGVLWIVCNLIINIFRSIGSIIIPGRKSYVFPRQPGSQKQEFILKVFEYIQKNNAAKKPVYQFLYANQSQLDDDLIGVLPNAVSNLLAINSKRSHQGIAITVSIFGDLIDDFPGGQKAINIELALAAYKSALQIISREAMPVEWAAAMINMAVTYKNRIRGSKAQNVEAAIDAFKQSLQVVTRDTMPTEWATAKMGLANAYRASIYGDKAQNIETAIAAYRDCLQVNSRKTMPIEWAEVMINLGNAYLDRSREGQNESLKIDSVEAAIDAYEKSLEVLNHYRISNQWSTVKSNLASAYRHRNHGDKVQNLENSIVLLKEALQSISRETMPIKWAELMEHLGDIYEHLSFSRFNRNASNVTVSNALPNDKADEIIKLFEDQRNGSKNSRDALWQALAVFKPDSFPYRCRRIAWSLATSYASEDRWADAVAPYELALASVEIIDQSLLSRSNREAELAEFSTLFRRAAYAQAQVGNFEKAVVTAEIGRARGLRKSLERDRADLKSLKIKTPRLIQNYQQALEKIHQFETKELFDSSGTAGGAEPLSQLDSLQKLEANHQKLNKAIKSIRKHPGYENFLVKPTFIDVASVVVAGRPLVYIISTISGGLALVVHKVQSQSVSSNQVNVSPVWLNDLNDKLLEEIVFGPEEGKESSFSSYAYTAPKTMHEAYCDGLDLLNQQMWNLIMGPVIDKLKTLNVSEAILIPMEALSFVPLHAAWIEDKSTVSGRRYAFDDITFTYSPNARSLRDARILGERTTARTLLAIKSDEKLRNSEYEVEAAAGYFKNKNLILKHEQASRNNVLAALPNYDVLHFACHGDAKLDEPLNSGLVMANNEILSLRDFLNTDLKGVRLVILSACDSGLSGMKLLDEVISLPAGLLQAGVAGVISSLWPVDDLSTMMLLVRFYAYWQDDNLNPDQALRQAQKWMRDSTNGEKVAYFKSFITDGDSLRMPHTVASSLYREMALTAPEDNDMAHPFYWAAFTYVGF